MAFWFLILFWMLLKEAIWLFMAMVIWTNHCVMFPTWLMGWFVLCTRTQAYHWSISVMIRYTKWQMWREKLLTWPIHRPKYGLKIRSFFLRQKGFRICAVPTKCLIGFH